ncbi:MAG: D-Ala-D-Ala carboxypeptidase family metallohydrolase [Gaiellaceae bacterium]
MAGFVPVKGTDWGRGDTPEIAKRLDRLAKRLGVTIYGISGYRSPGHSIEVGGFANDPHTKGQAGDIGVNSQLRASASQLTDAQLASVGLYRPFGGADEINHVQLASEGKSTMRTIVDAVGHTGASVAGALVGPAAKPAGDLVTNLGGDAAAQVDQAAADEAGKIAGSLIDDVWKSVEPRAAYAGLFVLLVGAGVWLAVTGLSRSSGLKEPA